MALQNRVKITQVQINKLFCHKSHNALSFPPMDAQPDLGTMVVLMLLIGQGIGRRTGMSKEYLVSLDFKRSLYIIHALGSTENPNWVKTL